MDALSRLDALPEAAARAELSRCCGAVRWVEAMRQGRPFASKGALLATCERAFSGLAPEDWLEAFRHHPRIGDKEALRARFASTRAWASSEQSAAAAAEEDVLDALAEGNRAYEERFGHIFIVCATGKTAEEMLALLRARLGNAPGEELRIASGEQAKITRLRLEKLLAEVTP